MVLGAAETLHALARSGAARIDIFRDRGRAHKAKGLDVWIVEQRVHRFPVAIDDVENALGQSRFHHQLGKP